MSRWNLKKDKVRNYYLIKDIHKKFNVIISGGIFRDQSINSDVKSHKEIRKLTAGQGKIYSTRYLLGYEYIKNHYKVRNVDLSRQKKLD